jgi:hypothetical protein
MSDYTFDTSAHKVVLACIRLGIPQKRGLEIYREIGGQIRDQEWANIWHGQWNRFREWADNQPAA